MSIWSKISEYHLGHRLEASVNGVLCEQVASENDLQRMAVGHIGEPEGRNGNTEIERVDAPEDAFGDAKWLKRSFAAPKNLTNGNKRRTFHVG